jgi:hypothetical protein
MIMVLAVPFAGAVLPGAHENWPVRTEPDFNLSGNDSANSTIPAMYKVAPESVRVEVMISDTLIPGPKGEMQTGPREIDPTMLLILVVAIIAASAGMWYLTKRRPQEPEGEDEENGD